MLKNQIIKLENIRHKALAKFTKDFRRTEVKYLKSKYIKGKEHVLYEVGGILVLIFEEYLISEFDEEFDHLWREYFSTQNNQR